MRERFKRGSFTSQKEESLLKPAVFSLGLHLFLLVLFGFSLSAPSTKATHGIYRVAIARISPLGTGSGTMPGGSGEPKQQEIFEPVRKPSGIPSTGQKGEKPKKTEPVPKRKEKNSLEGLKPSRKDQRKSEDSSKALEKAIEEIRRQAAIDRIQNRVARRQKEGSESGGRVPAGGSGGAGSGIGGSGAGSTGTGGSPSGSPYGSPSGSPSGSPFGSPFGSSSGSPSLLDIKLNEYYNTIWTKIKKEWTVPENLSAKKMDWEAVIVLVIDNDGTVQKTWFEKRSGNSLYDQMALRAIKKAEPLPPLPKEWSEKTIEIGIRFHLEE
jgi:TonB family protein